MQQNYGMAQVGTEQNDLATGRSLMGSTQGPVTSGLAFGGGTPDNTAATEEWTDPALFSYKNSEHRLIWQHTKKYMGVILR